MLEIGTKAPAFELPDQNGKNAYAGGIQREKGYPVFLSPRTIRPGCTKQAMRVRRAVSAVYGEGGCRAGSEQRQRGVS